MGTLTQGNWRVFSDANAEPVVGDALADENAAPTLTSATPIVRVRADILNTGMGAVNLMNLAIQYSTDDVNFTAMGVGNHWNWADGKGTDGDNVTTLLLTDTDTKLIYCETGSQSPSVGANKKSEFDFALQPTANATAGTRYYFRLLYGGSTVISLGSGKTHPQIITYSPPSGQPTASRHQSSPYSAVGFLRPRRQP